MTKAGSFVVFFKLATGWFLFMAFDFAAVFQVDH